MTRHEAKSMKQTTPRSDEVWYVDPGASNHMTSHKEWFSYLEKPIHARAVFRNKAELPTLEGIREHSICACTEGETEEAGREGREMYLGQLLDEQKGYNCYNPRTKQARVSRDVVFDESASWYLPPTPTPDSNPSSDEEVSEAEMPPDEPEIETESPISLRLSGLSRRLSRFDQY